MSDDGFLSRWSRRKVLVREGAPLTEPAPVPVVVSTPPAAAVAAEAAPPRPVEPAAPSEPATPPPTLDDVAQLTTDSDYTRFVARGVPAGVKNAALKKLFTDPHFNVMDGLDIYISDYGQPDPLPPGMLEQMFQSRALGLFPERDARELAAAEAAAAARLESAPAAAALPAAEPQTPLTPEPDPDEDTDLRLQPDDAHRRAGPEPGAGEDAGRPH
jgi:Protein of unknown function (DUF3306)